MSSWLVLYFALQAGLVSQTMTINDQTWQTPPNTLEATMEAKAVLFDHLELGGFMRSWQMPQSAFQWSPFRIDYGVEAALFWGPLRVGVRHECEHPVSDFLDGGVLAVPPNGNVTELFVRFAARVQF